MLGSGTGQGFHQPARERELRGADPLARLRAHRSVSHDVSGIVDGSAPPLHPARRAIEIQQTQRLARVRIFLFVLYRVFWRRTVEPPAELPDHHTHRQWRSMMIYLGWSMAGHAQEVNRFLGSWWSLGGEAVDRS